MNIGKYSFLPWMRQGLATELQAPAGGAIRATMAVELEVRGEGGEGGALTEPVRKDVELFGPGDVVGVEPKAIIKVEPADWITNFEPNYLPYIDFYDEDFPWRYTPKPPNQHRLAPWIMLVVLEEESEFEEVNDGIDRPLPAIRVLDPDNVLPAPADHWAWAHVHVNRALTPEASGDAAAENVARSHPDVAGGLSAVLSDNPDLAYSRIVSPRKLAPNKPYHAFLVPTYESGRLAGLGVDPELTPSALHAAWRAPYPGGATPESPGLLPVYHRWFFRTGARGDFEQLVRLLKPRPMDARVGRRDVDVLEPGSNVQPIDDADLAGILRLEGALRVPQATLSDADKEIAEKYDKWDDPPPHAFQTSLATLVNLKDDYAQEAALSANSAAGMTDSEGDPDPDPVMTPPIYGQWHARVARVLDQRDGTPAANRDNWVHELNLDPRWRAAAGFGTEVVQQNQERYMDAAWKQLGDVLAANRLMRFAQVTRRASLKWHTTQVQPMVEQKPGLALQLMAPVASRAMVGGLTARFQVRRSTVPMALLGTGFRRVARPRGRVMRRVARTRTLPTDDVITRVDRGEVVVVPPKVPPAQVPTPKDIRDGVPQVAGGKGSTKSKKKKKKPIRDIVSALARAFRLKRGHRLPAVGVGDLPPAPGEVDDLPSSPDFELSNPGDGLEPRPGRPDSPQSIRFKEALRDLYTLYEESGKASPAPVREPLGVASFTFQLHQALDPAVTLPKRVFGRIRFPEWIVTGMVETFVPAMAYPVFDQPMYEPLAESNSENLVPNLQYISDNTISLLETNQRFIEAYMVGLNHEFARELLWREYPTDQRGSYFRQFWDPSGYLSTDGTDSEALRERLRDIPKLHLWSRTSQLGDHDHRETDKPEEELVLVIRGELLKRYPNAVLYAHRARWQREDGKILRFKERRLVELSASEEESPPVAKLRTPLYEARVSPDIFFFGFDITATEARGGTGEDDADDPGWFFVIKERPGEPRFGLDVEAAGPDLGAWNDLAWSHVLEEPRDGKFLTPDHDFHVTDPGPGDERHEQWLEDRHIVWTSSGTNAADLAYILFQAPVMVAVHASEMLPRE